MAKQPTSFICLSEQPKPVARPETIPNQINEKKKNRIPENTHKLYPASLRLSISRFDELFNGISLTLFPCSFDQIPNPDSLFPSPSSVSLQPIYFAGTSAGDFVVQFN